MASFRCNSSSADPYLKLASQIRDEFKSIESTANPALEAKLRWAEELERIVVKRVLPGSRLILVGSSTNMFGFKHSDCDLTVVTKDRFVSEMECLRKIESALKPHRSRFDVESIYSAKVPILKVCDHISSYEGDISYNQENGIRSTYLLKCYAFMDPRVRPLALMIKKWAQETGITDARQHKLSGFAVILLVLFYLQKGCTLPVIPSLQESFPRHFGTTSTALSLAEKLCGSNKETVPFDVRAYRSRNSQTLGDLFVGFFKFYSTFSWEKVISVRKGDYVPLGYGGTWRKPHIRIEDPYQLGNVTKAVYEYGTSSAIKQAFKTALETLQINPSLASIM